MFSIFDFAYQEERSRSEDNLSNINKTHEKMKNDNKGTYYNYIFIFRLSLTTSLVS